MTSLTNFWKNKPGTETFRKIYKGEVPFLGDELDQTKKQQSKENTRKGKSTVYPQESVTSQQEVESETEPGESSSRPRQVKRHSLTPVPITPNKIAKVDAQQKEKFPNNLIVTARYSIWNFLPKNLFEQFRRVVNFYFLVMALIQSIVDTPIHPVTAVCPLAFVILVTAIKQGYEDWLRHKNDEQINNRLVKVIKDGILKDIKSKDIQVGDIIKLESDEQVPTDMLLLGSSDEFLRCQINTANLDGETNLKLRYCPSGLPHYKTVHDLNHLHIIVECEQPNENLYEFNGSLLIPVAKLEEMEWSPSESMVNVDAKGQPLSKEEAKKNYFAELMSGIVRQGMTDFLSIPLSMDNLVLRGTRLKNTEFIYGIVVYTGKHTRLAKNSEKNQSKFSIVEKAVNYYLNFFIFLLGALVIFCSCMHFLIDWYPGTNGSEDPWYTSDNKNKDTVGILNIVASFIILFNYIIPISLYVTIEMQKFIGSKFFVWDQDMVDEEGREPLCNTSDLNEELGQIEYLFSDKTGTLTKNIMKFRHCSVDSVRYEYHSDHKLYLVDSTTQKPKPDSPPLDILANEKVLIFLKNLALCHSVQVVPKRRQSFDLGVLKSSYTDLKVLKRDTRSELERRRETLVTPEPSGFKQDDFQFQSTEAGNLELEYQASSPDEKALLESSEALGIVYKGEKEDILTLEVLGKPEKYKRLMHLEFDSERKCMSVIVENPKGEKWLLTKGAESSIIPKCDSGPTNETLKHVMDFALMGLRTLVVAERKLTNSEYDEFNMELHAARRLIKNRQEKVREVFNTIEAHMTLIGATGVEDQLQDFVPETLQAFAAAGIRVWMLTGDKLETGVNVAISCGLITASTTQYIISNTLEPHEIREKMTQINLQMEESENTCFVIDGGSLSGAFRNCPDLLRQVSMKAFRVVCCRMAPLQKAQVVQMVKNSAGSPVCCAVGDGANDCAMILAAHIGIGILGKEGRQAARCADFALAKFGHLRKAILVHGHWYYVRLANLCNYSFYKNVVFVMPQLFFSFDSNFSTQAIFHALFLMCYNIFFSSCPIFIYGLFEQPYSAKTQLVNPHLYKINKKNHLMTMKQFTPWFLSALWHAAVSYYLPYFAWDNFDSQDNIMTFGTVVFTAVVLSTNIKMAIETKYLTWYYLCSQLYSFVTFFLITALYTEVDLSDIGITDIEGDFHNVFFEMLRSVSFWILMGLVSVASVLPDLTFACIRSIYRKVSERPLDTVSER